ncbi:MAG: hypothetical protein QOG72_2802 [Sphingomonadales bacterium]|jgi:hypothetical protein|nr:hypothetical protein [Sphingomonadales bacterium]
MGAKTLKLAALATALGAMLAVTPGAALAGGTKPKAAKDDPSRRVCRSVIPMGTRLATRICRPYAEWAEEEKAAQEGVLNRQTEGFVRMTPAASEMGGAALPH